MRDVPSHLRAAHACDLGRVPYAPTLELQRSLRAAREAGDLDRDLLLVLEHDDVITCGTRTEYADIALASTMDIPIVPVERGGRATWHGPGQVVMYPIFDLAGAAGGDVKLLVRRLEQAIIDTLSAIGLDAARADGYPGVWVGGTDERSGRKVASLGLRVTRGVTFHGIALNVTNDLAPFGWFTPCGIPDVTMTSIAAELGDRAEQLASTDVRSLLAAEIAAQFGLDLQPVARAELDAIAARHPQPASDLALPTPAGRGAVTA